MNNGQMNGHQSFDVQVKTHLVCYGGTISSLAKELGLGVAHLSAVVRGDKGIPEIWAARENYPNWFRQVVLRCLIEAAQRRLGVLSQHLWRLEGEASATAEAEGRVA